MQRRFLRSAVLFVASVATDQVYAQAEPYPSRPVRIVIPTASGGNVAPAAPSRTDVPGAFDERVPKINSRTSTTEPAEHSGDQPSGEQPARSPRR